MRSIWGVRRESPLGRRLCAPRTEKMGAGHGAGGIPPMRPISRPRITLAVSIECWRKGCRATSTKTLARSWLAIITASAKAPPRHSPHSQKYKKTRTSVRVSRIDYALKGRQLVLHVQLEPDGAHGHLIVGHETALTFIAESTLVVAGKEVLAHFLVRDRGNVGTRRHLHHRCWQRRCPPGLQDGAQ